MFIEFVKELVVFVVKLFFVGWYGYFIIGIFIGIVYIILSYGLS